MFNYIFQTADTQVQGEHACFKQSVSAMLSTINGQTVFGSNKINNKVSECPRDTAGFVSGQGYHLCKEICNQNAHAEVDAIQTAKKLGFNIKGATITLIGHTHCCDNCTNTMISEGIAQVLIIGEDSVVHTILDLNQLPTSLLFDDRLGNVLSA